MGSAPAGAIVVSVTQCLGLGVTSVVLGSVTVGAGPEWPRREEKEPWVGEV